MADTRLNQNTGQIPPVETITQQNDKRVMQKLQEEFGKAGSAIDLRISDDIRAINNQFVLKQRAMRTKFDRERDPARKQSIEQQMADIKTQFEGKMQGVRDKYHPTKREMKGAYDAEVGKLKQAAQQRDMKLQTIRQLTTNGFITDPAIARQAEYKMLLGIDVPLSALRPQGPDPKEVKASLIRDIRSMDNILKRFTPGKVVNNWFDKRPKLLDEITGETRELDPDNKDDAIIISNMRNLASQKKQNEAKLQELYLQIPEYRQAIQGSQERKDAADMHLPSNKAAKGGGIKESITNTISKQGKKLDHNTATKILQQAGGDYMLAKKMARSQGYK